MEIQIEKLKRIINKNSYFHCELCFVRGSFAVEKQKKDSDIDLLIVTDDFTDTYYICIPVKSGVEITKKVTEDIAYQVIRPFTYFGNKAIVIFISAKEATEPFYNYVKRAKANLNFDIYVIAGKELVKLLKFNNQI